MYGIGNRLDSSPELLFALRGVDHQELIEQAIPTAPARARALPIETSELGAIFDIEIDDPAVAGPPASKPRKKQAPKVEKAAATKVAPVKEATAKKTAKVPKAANKKTASVKKATGATKKKATPVSKKG